MPALNEDTTNFITRMEYEARYSALVVQLTAIEARLNNEQASLKVDIDKKFDKVIDGLEKLKEDVYSNRTQALRYIVSVLVSFLLGGGGIALLEYLLSGK